jgi:hypothetical protein
MAVLSTIAGLAGALTLSAASPAMAAAPPVSVVSCDYTSLQGDGVLFVPAAAPIVTGNVRITFVNTAPLSATDVHFAVSYDNTTQIVDEAGTFSSGTSITRDITPSTDPYYNGAAACSVESVTFSDGSTWQPV